jgi:bifunctional non-homologous end joining protein LigD
MRDFSERQPQLSLPFREPYLRFVVHEHQATRHHYDLRLELCGVLLDIVLPKGPSTDPDVYRLAIFSHDHARSCLGLEGRIREGAYGAGPLLMWDRGLYAPHRCPPGMSHEEAILLGLRRGELYLTLYGHKLRGTWKLKHSPRRWLLIKVQDEFASTADIRLKNQSVLTGRTLGEL